MKYLVFSTIGNKNYGDESMATNYIEKNLGWKNIDLITYYDKNVSKWITNTNIINPFENIIFDNKFKKMIFMSTVIINPKKYIKKLKIDQSLKEYKSFTMIGGGNLNAKYVDTLINIYLLSLIFYKNNKEIYFRPQSVGPFKGLKGFYGKIILKRILKMSTEFLVRENQSHTICKKIMNSEKIKLKIDDAWSLDIKELKNEKLNEILNNNKKKIAISVRPWNKKDLYIEKFEMVVNESIKRGYEVYFVPIAFGGDNSYIDNSFLKNKFKNKENIYFIEDYINLNKIFSSNIKYIISKMDVCIGLSYHFNVYSQSLDKKTLAIYSDEYYYIKNFGLYSILDKCRDVIDIEKLNIYDLENLLN